MMRQCFVPPKIIENMAREGVDGARDAVSRAEHSRTSRELGPAIVATTPSPVRVDPPQVIVWDCRGEWRQQVVQVTSSDAREKPDPDSQEAKALDFVVATLAWLQGVLGRQGIDGQGSTVHVNIHFGEDYPNAFWDGKQLTLGDGDGTVFGPFVYSIDVVAHEMAHGVVQHTGALRYEGQSGALNEHFADVLGTAIQKSVSMKGPPDWLIGNEIMAEATRGDAIRSVAAPGTAYDNKWMGRDPQPDHMDNIYEGDDDNGGVHINSGIMNRAFYIVAKEIGAEITASIWFHALEMLWETATFSDAVTIITNVARAYSGTTDLAAGTVPEGTPQLVRYAFRTVGL